MQSHPNNVTTASKLVEWKQLQQRNPPVETGLAGRLLNWKRRQARDTTVKQRRDETGCTQNSQAGQEEPTDSQRVQNNGEKTTNSSTLSQPRRSLADVKQDVEYNFEEEKIDTKRADPGNEAENKQHVGKLHPAASRKAQDRANARLAFDDLGDGSDDNKPDYSSALGRQPRGGRATTAGRRVVEESDEDDEYVYCRDLEMAKQRNKGGMRSDILDQSDTDADTDSGRSGCEDTHSSADARERNSESDNDSEDGRFKSSSPPVLWNRRVATQSVASDCSLASASPNSTGRKLWFPGQPKPLPDTRFESDNADQIATSSRSLYNPRKVISSSGRGHQGTKQSKRDACMSYRGMDSISGRVSLGGGSASEENSLNENPRSNMSPVNGKKLYHPGVPSKSKRTPKQERIVRRAELKDSDSLVSSFDESQSAAAKLQVAALERAKLQIAVLERVAAFQKPTVDSIRVPSSPVRPRGRGMPGTVKVLEDIPQEHGVEWWAENIRAKKRLAQEYLKLLQIDPSAGSAMLDMNGIKLDLESRCWKFAFYNLIEEFRGYLATNRSREMAVTINNLFMTFLGFASVYYRDFAKVLIMIETKPVGIPRWHRCIGVQGDLARYKALSNGGPGLIDTSLWEEARGWYSLGLKLGPGNGKIYNQLAIMASGGDLESLYYYCRSQTVRQPFHAARESIQSLFENNRLKVARQPPRFLDMPAKLSGGRRSGKMNLSLPTSIPWNIFEMIFVRLHGIMFTKIGLDSIDTFLVPFLSARPENSLCSTDFALFFYFEAAMINLSALHGYAPGHFASSVTTPSEERTSWLPSSAHLCTLPYIQTKDDIVQWVVAPRITFGMMKHAMDTYVQERGLVELNSTSSKNKSTLEGLVVYVEVVLMWMVGSGVLSAFGEGEDGSLWNLRYGYVETLHWRFWNSLAAFLTQLAEESSDETIKRVVSFVAERELPVPPELTSKLRGVPVLKLSSPPTPEDFAIRGTAFFSSTHGSRGFDEFVSMTGYYATALPPDEVSPVGREEGLWTREEEENARVHRRRRAVELGLWIAKYVEGFEYDPLSRAFTAASSLEVTRSRNKGVEPESSEVEPFSESDNGEQTVEHEEEDEEDVDSSDDEDVRTLRALKAKRKQLKDLLGSTRERTSTPDLKKQSRAPSMTNVSDLVQGHSVLVIDTNFFVGDLGLVRKIMESGMFPVVVPLVVITELSGLQRNQTELGEAAGEALTFLDKFVKMGPKRLLRILTSKGNVVPGIGFSEEFTLSRGGDGEEDQEEGEEKTKAKLKQKTKDIATARNLDDLILATCLVLRTSSGSGSSKHSAEEPVLVTGDANLRLKARAREVRTLDGYRLARGGEKEGWW